MAKDKPVTKKPEATEARTNWTWIIIAILIGLIIVAISIWMGTKPAEAKPEVVITPACKVENAECKTNDSNKLCCPGLVCMDKGLPSENGKCQLEPTPTATPTPTPTPTPPACPSWTCGECSDLYSEELNGFLAVKPPACMDEKKYCEETYDCKWVCPTEDKCKKEDKIWSCDCPVEPTPTPTTEPTNPPARTESKPEGCTQNCGVPACTDTVPKEVANPHVYRNGDCAIVKWMPTEGNKANIYWKENSSGDWQHSLAGIDNTGYREICGLGSLDFTFGVQSVNGCAADGIINASNMSVIVDGNTGNWVLFR